MPGGEEHGTQPAPACPLVQWLIDSTHPQIGWSDLALLAFFKNLHVAVDQVFFRSYILKQSARSAARASHAWQSYLFQKITGTLKIVSDLNKGKNNFFEFLTFSSFLALTKIKEYVLPCRRLEN